MSFVIVRGESVPVLFPVRTWLDHGLHFARPMRRVTRVVMNHWTGSENGGEALYRNLREARDVNGNPAPKSVNFFVDHHGVCWQFADAEARCSHARGMDANTYSVGIEIQNRATDMRVRDRGIDREMRTDIIHGRLVRYRWYTPDQLETVLRLNVALCQAYQLPCRVPQQRGDVFTGCVPATFAAHYFGVMGHYMVEPAKYDPGPQLLRLIHERGKTPDEPMRLT